MTAFLDGLTTDDGTASNPSAELQAAQDATDGNPSAKESVVDVAISRDAPSRRSAVSVVALGSSSGGFGDQVTPEYRDEIIKQLMERLGASLRSSAASVERSGKPSSPAAPARGKRSRFRGVAGARG